MGKSSAAKSRRVCTVLVGCECDSICEANRSTDKFLKTEPTDEQIIDYLNLYKGEAPNAETYGAIINWGLETPDRFIELVNHPSITTRNLDLIVYKIADYGNHSEWCDIFTDLNERTNDRYIRDKLLGCSYGL